MENSTNILIPSSSSWKSVHSLHVTFPIFATTELPFFTSQLPQELAFSCCTALLRMSRTSWWDGGDGGHIAISQHCGCPHASKLGRPISGRYGLVHCFPKYWEHSELKKQTKGEPQRSRKLMASHDIRRKVRSWHRTLLCKPNKLHKLHQSWRPNAGSKLKPFKCFAKSLYTSTTRGLAKGFPEVLWSMWSMNIHDILRR